MQKSKGLSGSYIVINILLAAIVLFSSCNIGKKVPYFIDVPDSTGYPLTKKPLNYSEPRIRPNDILGITIQTIDPQASEVFNNGGTASTGSAGNSQAGGGYLVDNNGEIELPLVGRMKVAGMTTIEARTAIREAAKRFYVDPAVNVRFLNFNVTLLGDVSSPGTYNIQSERVSILDALGMAGDLAITAKRDNVMLVREEKGEKIFIRLDINNSDLVSSPYFYLKSGDVIYVEPNKAKAKIASVDPTRDKYIGYILSSITLLISVVNFIRLVK